MTRSIVAVSGGVDSVVLLDALARRQTIAGIDPWQGLAPGELIVAHFDHGIRDDSAEDARFVRELAQHYGLAFESIREELGADASEQLARSRRYRFFAQLRRQYDAPLVTAHHANDLAESIAINMTRGTGWRGVAAMDTRLVVRPLVRVLKREIVAYAHKNGLKWREDSTNASDRYLRNRIRKKAMSDDVVWQLAALWARQCELKREIDTEAQQLAGTSPYPRYFLTHCGDAAADELLRAIFVQETGRSPVLAARVRALHAVKAAKPHRTIHVGDGAILRFTPRGFIVDTEG